MIKKFIRFSIKNFTSFLLTIFFSQIILAQNTAEQITSLELNKLLDRKITGDAEKQNFQIALSANQSATIIIEQTHVDVSAKIFDADGKLLNVFDDEPRLKQNEIVEFVAPQTGSYKIEIKTTSKAWTGNYKITFTETRAATENDLAIYEARTTAELAKEARNAEKFDEAAALYKRALDVAEKRSEASAALLTVRILNGLIEVILSKGDYPAALILLARAADFDAKNLGANHPQTALTTFLRGQYFRLTGDRANADRNYRQALATYENALGKDHSMLFDLMLRLSALHISINDYDPAVAYLQRAEKIVELNYGVDHKLMAGVVNNLGVVYMSKNDDALAEKYYLKVIEIGEKNNEVNQYRYTLTMQNLGVIYRRKKDYKKALEYYERALQIREKILGGEHTQVAWALYGIAGVYSQMGEEAKALELLRRVREITEKSVGLYDNLTTVSISDSARIFAAQGETERAVALQKTHDERYEKWFASEMTIGSERQKLQSVTRVEKLTSTTISLHLNAARNNQAALDLAALAVLQRKGRVLDAVADNLAAIRRRANETDRVLLDHLNDVNARLAKLTLGKPAKIPLDEHQKQIAELERQKEQIEIEIGDQNAKFTVQTPSVTLNAIKTEIPEDAALVEFAVYLPLDFKKENSDEAFGEPRYVAYVLRKNGAVKYAELGDKKTLDKIIAELRKALGDAKSKNVKLATRAADEKIMQPVRALVGDAKQIFVSPDGDLNLIPFEALVDETGKYLIEKYSFNYLTSGRDLLRMKTARPNKSEISIIANPSFGAQANAEPDENISSKTATRNLSDTYFAPLAGTIAEARAIQNYFPARRFFRKDARMKPRSKRRTRRAFCTSPRTDFFSKTRAD